MLGTHKISFSKPRRAFNGLVIAGLKETSHRWGDTNYQHANGNMQSKNPVSVNEKGKIGFYIITTGESRPV